MILVSMVAALLAMAIAGHLVARLLLPGYEGLDLPDKASSSLLFGWPLFALVVIAFAFFYVGLAVFLGLVAVGLAYLTWSAVREPRRPIRMPGFELSAKTLAWTLVIITCAMMMYSAIVMAWPPIGDVIAGHAPRTALFQLNQKVPLYPSPYLILYPPGFSALCATLNSAFGEVPGIAVLAVGASILVSIIIGVFFLSRQILGGYVWALFPAGFIFALSPDLNMERWIVGHYLSGTYANFFGYMVLLSYIAFMWFFTRSEVKVYWKLAAMAGIHSAALAFTYPPFVVYVLIFTLATLVLGAGGFNPREALRSHGRLMLAVIAPLAAAALIVALTRGSYETSVIIGYIAGSYVLGGSGVFGTYTAYVLPVQSFLSDWRNWVLIFSVATVLWGFRSRRDAFSMGVFAVPSALALASFIPGISGYMWFFFSSRTIALLQVLGFIYLCLFLKEKIYPRIAGSLGRGRAAAGSRWRKVLVFAFLAVAVAASFTYASANAGAWGWYTRTPYFADDIGGVQYVCGQTATPDLIMGDNTPASQYIMTIGVRNLTCFDYVRVSQPDLYSAASYYWDHPQDTDYLRSLVSSRNVSWIVLCTDPVQVVVDSGGNLVYREKPFPQQTYLEVLDSLPFLRAEYQSGSTRCYRVVGD